MMSISACGNANIGGHFRFTSSAILALCIGVSVTTKTWTDARAEEPIKVGLLLTYVGPTAIFARYEDKGARLLIDQINESGGIKGRPIELVNYDTEGKPDRAGTLYRRLAEEDNVVAVIGPDSIFVLLGMSDIPTEVKLSPFPLPVFTNWYNRKNESTSSARR